MSERHLIKEWMDRVIAATGWSAARWAHEAGTTPSNITRLRSNPDGAAIPRSDTLAKLAAAVPPSLGIDPPNFMGWKGASLPEPSPPPAHDDAFVAHPVPVPPVSHLARNLPVYGLAQGGCDGAFEMNGSVIEYTETPTSLAGVRGAYGVYVSGESMSPRFEPGWLLHVHPHKQPRSGDNVVIQIRPRDEHEPPLAYVKTLVSWDRSGGRLVVQQFNPPKELTWEGEDVVSVHKIVGVAYE